MSTGSRVSFAENTYSIIENKKLKSKEKHKRKQENGMNTFNRQGKKTNLEKQIDTVTEQMSKMEPDSKEYIALLGTLERLTNLKSKGHTKEIPWGTVITCSVALLQTIMILHAERVGVITSKAVGFIMRGRA